MSKLLLCLLVFVGSTQAIAQSKKESDKDKVIKFNVDELARETVLPVFEKAPMVKNRRVVSAGRLELGGGIGYTLAEPFYEPMNYSATLAYYFTEQAGVVFSPLFLSSSLSKKGLALKDGDGLAGKYFDASLAPSLTSIYFLDYQMNAFYGKISITKQSVVNLSLYFLMGLAIPTYEDSSSSGLNLGFGQKYYFGPNSALRFDLRFAYYQGLNLPSDDTRLDPINGSDESRSSSDFDKTWMFQSFLNLQFVFMI